MDFRYTDDQNQFRTALRDFLQQACPPARVREIAAAGGHDPNLWRRMCGELELPGLHVSDRYGGSGATLSETAIAFEELGRALTPAPLLGTVAVIEALLRMGSAEQRNRLLPALVRGTRIGAIAACPDITRPADTRSADAVSLTADFASGAPVLTGECSPVLDDTAADLFVLPAVTDGAAAAYLVAADAPGLAREPLPSFDPTRPVSKLTLAGTPAEPLTAPGGWNRTLDVTRVLIAAEALGGATACLQKSVEYACQRTQFGRPIGSFQAVKHACAEMMVEIEATRVAVMFAALTAGDPGQLALTAPLVKAQAADTFTLCAETALQVHGGIAFTWEHDIHLYYRRAKTTEALFGGSTHHRALLADRVGL